MKYNKILLGILLLLMLFSTARSENQCGVMIPCSDTSSWGLGCIQININDQIVGWTDDNNKCIIRDESIIIDNKSKSSINDTDLLHLADYQTVLLKVREKRNNGFRICTNSLKGGIWVALSELNAKSLHFETYYSFIKENKNQLKLEDNVRHINVGVNLFNSCLYLRDLPNNKGKIITCLQNNYHDDPRHTTTHLEIQNVTKDWALVIARIYVYDPEKDPQPDECAMTLIREYKGYVKVIGKKGIPNIWYALSTY